MRQLVVAVAVAACSLGSWAAEAQVATLHKNTRRGGTAIGVTGDIASLAAVGFDDQTSSITMRSDQPIAVFQDPGFGGRCLTVRGNIERTSDVGFGNDNISSVRVAWTCEQGAYEVDACRVAPCGAGFTCTDKPRPAPNAWDGRTCTPIPGQPVSLATGKPARQSSTQFGGDAARAVDGQTDGAWGASSVTHTGAEAGWLEIDLGAVTDIASVVLHNRTDCCSDRLIGAVVELAVDPCDRGTMLDRSAPVATAAASHARTFTPPVPARYVCVRHKAAKYLSLAEVQVFGPKPTLEPIPVGLGVFDTAACPPDAIPVSNGAGARTCRRATEVKTLSPGTRVVIAAMAPLRSSGPGAPMLVATRPGVGVFAFLAEPSALDYAVVLEVVAGFVPGTVMLKRDLPDEYFVVHGASWNVILRSPGDLFSTEVLPPAPGRPEVVLFNVVRPLAPHPGNPTLPLTFVACMIPVVASDQHFLLTTDTGRGDVERCTARSQFRFFQLAD